MVFRSLGGLSFHPAMLIPYNVSSKTRRPDAAKWIFAYLSSNADETEAWEKIGNYINL